MQDVSRCVPARATSDPDPRPSPKSLEPNPLLTSGYLTPIGVGYSEPGSRSEVGASSKNSDPSSGTGATVNPKSWAHLHTFLVRNRVVRVDPSIVSCAPSARAGYGVVTEPKVTP